MPSITTRTICALLAMMLSLAGLPAWSVVHIPAPERPECACCDTPGGDCCVVSDDHAPAPPLPPTDSRSQQSLRDAVVPQRPLLLVLAVADVIFIPTPCGVFPRASTGHSRQSILCARTV